MRDTSGSSQLYYSAVGGRVVFSTDVKTVAGAHWIPQTLDDLWIAKHLIDWYEDVDESTVYRHIRKVPPAHIVTARADGVTVARYWSTEGIAPVIFKDDRDYARLLRDGLAAAVRVRIRSGFPVGTLLSAGLDSSAVTVMAARECGSAGRGIVSFTHVPESDLPEPFDEGRAASDLAATLPNVHHLLVRPGAWTPVKAIRRSLELFGVPGLVNSNSPFLFSTIEAARGLGIRTLMTGQAGNRTMDWVKADDPRVSLLDLARLGRLKNVARRLIRPFSAYRPADLVTLGASWEGAPINPQFAESLGLRRRLVEAGWSPHVMLGPRRGGDAVLKFVAGKVGGMYAQIRLHEAVGSVDPYTAKPLVELAASVPPGVWLRHPDRGLFREAMKDVLPESTRLRRWRGIQSADFAARLAAHPTELSEALVEIERSPLATHYMNAGWCRTLAQAVVAGRGSPKAGFSRLMSAMGMGLFLASLDGKGWSPEGLRERYD